MSSKCCLACNLIKPFDAFGKHKGRKFGLADRCKECRNPAVLLKRHNITHEQKEAMLKAQDYKCAICPSIQILSIDHCHKTGTIRGILCPNCNFGIGHFKDNIKLLQSAIDYLINALTKERK